MFKNKKIKIFITVFLLAFMLTFTFPSIAFADQATDVSSFVTRLYQTCLDRGPDAAGLDNWVSNLISGKVTGGQAAYGFVFSEELKNRNLNNDQFLAIMYRAFFDRPADTGGYNNWMGLLNGGYSREFVFSNFVNSTEFANICANYGIQAGTVTVANTGTAATTQGKDPKIVGSEAYYNLIVQALNILAQKDPEVYNQYASVSRIEERPLSNALGATYGSVVYMDLSKRQFNEMPFEMEIACTLSHEFNHVTYWNHPSRYNKYITEQWAFAQEYNTGLKVGAPAVYLNYISYMYYNVFLYYQRYVPRDFVLEPAA
ncbi:MAG: DUF4214 domain-containing protein [Actinobacteria bacterium]|nr:DUF4214 domain-containing protein [Actinomycetota bacterium]